MGDVHSRHDVGSKLGRDLEGLANLVYWNIQEVRTEFLVIDGLLFDQRLRSFKSRFLIGVLGCVVDLIPDEFVVIASVRQVDVLYDKIGLAE